ncbi:MAG: fructose-1,6-bisphosphatase, partial [Hyphomicrobiales bacterium]|nr:fructose-1,6-bisphosphatase [Hyphomicrobiales bacterium]
LPATGAPDADPDASFLQAGVNQLGAGFFIYGPQLALVLSLGSGTHVFVLSTRLGTFIQAYESRVIPSRTQEFAINAANYRHWDEAVRLYIDDCMEGTGGPRGKDFNMRWIASLVADCYRILMRGGVFLYPSDQRKGYRKGRLRLVYEANPIAYLVEQAAGVATDGVNRILEITPESLHQRVPVVFGSAREVERIARYHTQPSGIGERSPLFGNRGLFRV